VQAWEVDPDDPAEPPRHAWTLAEPANGLTISPDGRTLALGDRSGAVALVDAGTGKVRARLAAPPGSPAVEGPVIALAFAPDGRELAVAAQDGPIRIWSVDGSGPGPERIVRLPGHRGIVTALAYDDSGRRLATGGADKVVDVWDVDRLRTELDRLGLGW